MRFSRGGGGRAVIANGYFFTDFDGWRLHFRTFDGWSLLGRNFMGDFELTIIFVYVFSFISIPLKYDGLLSWVFVRP